MLGGASLIALLLVRRHDLRADRHRFLLLALFVYVLPGLAYFLCRWSYYGLLLPNTFYAKTHGSHLFGFAPRRGTIWDIEEFIADISCFRLPGQSCGSSRKRMRSETLFVTMGARSRSS